MRSPHVPIMVGEVLEILRPAPGDVIVDCTLGGGGHAEALLERILPGGRLIGFDVDREALATTTDRLRASGYGPQAFLAQHANFATLLAILAAEGVTRADVLVADLGVSTMQADDESRGFSYKGIGPLDMRMNREAGETAAALIARVDEAELARMFVEHADEPHAATIAALIKAQRLDTTHALERCVRTGLAERVPSLTKSELKIAVRRVFQALRIAVNDEFQALDALLAHLPGVLAPGGRVAILTFHSGEDRRVKQAFRHGHRAGLYSSIARRVIQSSKEETRANRRSMSAKLRWAVRRDLREANEVAV